MKPYRTTTCPINIATLQHLSLATTVQDLLSQELEQVHMATQHLFLFRRTVLSNRFLRVPQVPMNSNEFHELGVESEGAGSSRCTHFRDTKNG